MSETVSCLLIRYFWTGFRLSAGVSLGNRVSVFKEPYFYQENFRAFTKNKKSPRRTDRPVFCFFGVNNRPAENSELSANCQLANGQPTKKNTSSILNSSQKSPIFDAIHQNLRTVTVKLYSCIDHRMVVGLNSPLYGHNLFVF